MALAVHLDESCGDALRSIFLEGQPLYFKLTAPEAADLIVFGRDDRRYIKLSPLFKRFPSRCVAVTEWDRPAFFLPTVCASSSTNWLTRGRAETMSYIVSSRGVNAPAATFAEAPRRYLYSFLGKPSNRVRRLLFRQFAQGCPPDVRIENTGSLVFNHTQYPATAVDRFAEIMAQSKFALCPRGWGTGSIRLFEACRLGVAPVIIADGWQPVRGVDWSFAIFLREKHIAGVDALIRSHESEWNERGRAALAAYQQHFSPEVAAERLFFHLSNLRASLRPPVEHMIRATHP